MKRVARFAGGLIALCLGGYMFGIGITHTATQLGGSYIAVAYGIANGLLIVGGVSQTWKAIFS